MYSDRIYNWLMSHWKVLQMHQKDWLEKNFMRILTRCILRKHFRAPNIGLSQLQNVVVGFVTTFWKCLRKQKRVW